MKKSFVFIAFLIFSWSAKSQDLKVPRFYELREVNAPQAVKQELLRVRQEITANKLSYVVGVTSVAGRPIEKITGEKQLSIAEEKKIFDDIRQRIVLLERAVKALPYRELVTIPSGFVYGTPSQKKLDLRKGGLVGAVQDQGGYGTCWSFGALASYESNYKHVNNVMVNASEQHVINCSGAGDSGGGIAYEVFRWMVDNHRNVNSEAALPYNGAMGTCPAGSPPTDFFATEWGMVDPSIDPWKIASVAKIKNALCKYGAISASLKATNNFKLYAGGQFFEFESNYSNPTSNHAVSIIGWDDDTQCWLIKNSWGTDWGSECGYGSEKGYMWIKYNSNNIGRRAAWVRAEKKINYPFGNGTTWHDYFCVGSEIPLVGDFNGDGKDDIVSFTRGNAGDVFVALSDGSKFNGNGVKWHDNFCMGTEIPLVGDFNGDGKDDIVTFTQGTANDVFVALSDGSKFTGTAVKWHDYFCTGAEIPLVGDFSGDGKADIATFTRGTSGEVFVATSTGTAFTGTGTKWHDKFCYGSEIPVAGDYNGDKKCDILTFLLNATADVFGATSSGKTFSGSGVKVHDWFGLPNEIPMTGDFNGDGKADLITFLRNTQPEPGRGDVYVALSK